MWGGVRSLGRVQTWMWGGVRSLGRVQTCLEEHFAWQQLIRQESKTRNKVKSQSKVGKISQSVEYLTSRLRI
ncbi:rCG52484 [Rattus norvegicus]|uniref:RCG52484 n=1 Tax=Rattus norvegicus TaxID=10116 RepID=A6K0T1_RAT|nr:rCG52484 [Rattus norvegicus]